MQITGMSIVWDGRGAAGKLSAERRKTPRRRIIEPPAVLQLFDANIGGDS